MRETRSKWMLAFVLLSAGIVGVQMTLFWIQFVFHVRMPMNLLHYCLEWLRYIPMPVRMTLMQLLLGSSLLFTAAAIVRECYASLHWRNRLRQRQLRQQAEEWGARHGLNGGQLAIIRHPAALAMTIGLFRPRIVLSTGLIDALTAAELDAVMAHESCHLKRKHPLAMFVLAIIGRAFWYIPIYRWFKAKYNVMIELAADRYAIRATGGAADLGSAMLVMLKRGPSAAAPIGSVSFADNAINARLKQLLDPHFKMSFRPPVVPCVISAVAFVYIVLGV